jgi:hypothetical protein
MSLYKMTGRKSRAKTEFSGKNTGCDDTSELSSVVTRVCGMWTSYA